MKSQRLAISKYNKNDIENRYRILSNNEIMYYYPNYQYNSYSNCEKDTTIIINNEKEELKQFFFKICKDDIYLGEIRYQVIGQLNEFQLVNLQIFMGFEEDYMLEAIIYFVNYLFKDKNVLKVIVEVISTNHQMINILEECGFDLEKEVTTEFNNEEVLTLVYKTTKRSWKYDYQ